MQAQAQLAATSAAQLSLHQERKELQRQLDRAGVERDRAARERDALDLRYASLKQQYKLLEAVVAHAGGCGAGAGMGLSAGLSGLGEQQMQMQMLCGAGGKAARAAAAALAGAAAASKENGGGGGAFVIRARGARRGGRGVLGASCSSSD